MNRDEARQLAGPIPARPGLSSPRATARPPASASTTTPRRSWSAKPAWNGPTSSWARACACGAGPTAGSGRSRRRNSAPISRPRASSPASSTRSPKTPRVPISTADQARSLAEDFLRTRCARDPASLDFVEAPPSRGPTATDRVFTWKERDFDLHDATYRAGGHRPRQRGRRLSRIPEDPRPVDPRLPAPALQERCRADVSTPPSCWRWSSACWW